MTKHIYLWIIFLLYMPLLAQENSEIKNNNITRGRQILLQSQKSIGSENLKLKSFSFKVKFNYDESKSLDSIRDISVLLPDKICLVRNSDEPFPTRTTSIWNGEKHKKFSESDYFGQRMIVDMTKSLSDNETLGKLADKIGKEKVEKMKISKRLDEKERFYNDVWWSFFGITLIHPFEQNLEYKYIGNAKSGNTTANVLEIKAKNGRNYRLLFDADTKYLLMLIESYKVEEGESENKYYYTNRELVNSMSIPRKIKIENRFTPIGKKTANVSYVNIDILEFSLNPKLKEGIFEIK